ncbi:LuxR family transcriptional regulator [Qaidamihabitans albus]|uniref:LuxR family transcriptional regulator n=1 Tax=Qaidamihabitans albus TaxID=2795733 RepID=UPI0018F18EA7|nr:LuxR family transcriptional regulator [Qaidamihabitans albus]
MHKFSLDALARELLKLATGSPQGRSAKTVYGGHEHVLRQSILTLTSGNTLAEHENPGEAALFVLRGRVRLHAAGISWEGRHGDLIVIPQSRHRVEALEDSAVLLTVAKIR